MNVHIALYKFRPEITKSRIEKALLKVAALADEIPGIIEISTAENTSKYGEGYTHVILVRGENQKSMDAYRSHPDHQTVARELDAMEERGVGVDFETGKPGQ
jgi:hypothetical protein